MVSGRVSDEREDTSSTDDSAKSEEEVKESAVGVDDVVKSEVVCAESSGCKGCTIGPTCTTGKSVFEDCFATGKCVNETC